MSKKETIEQIVSNLDTITKLDVSKLYPNSPSIVLWNDLNNDELKKFVEGVLFVLKRLKKDIHILNGLAPGNLNKLKANLEAFVSHFNSFESQNLVQVTSEHHGTLNHIEVLDNTLRLTGLNTELKLAPGASEVLGRLENANNQLKDFDEEEFKRAISLVKSLIEQKVSFEEKTIKDNLGTFINRANEHKTHMKRDAKTCGWHFWRYLEGQWWWLLGAIICGAVVMYIVASFIAVLKDATNISTGSAILRISSLAVPSFFMFFFVNQYTYHKKMYEVYSFKNTAMNIMAELMLTNQEKSDLILERGLEILFSEPKSKDSAKYDQQLVSDLLSIVKNQIK